MRSIRFLPSRLRGDGFGAVLARGAGGAFFAQSAALGVGFGLHLTLARALGADSYGVYSYAFAWIALLAFLCRLGLGTGIVRLIGEAQARDRFAEMRGALDWSDRVVMIVAIVTAACMGALLVACVDHIEPELRMSLAIGLLALPILALLGIREATLRAFRHPALAFAPDGILRTGLTAIGVAVTAALYPALLSAPVAMSCTAIAAGTALGFARVAIRRVEPRELASAASDRKKRREWLHFALPLLLLGGVNLIQRRADVLMLGALVGTTEAGFYTAAGRYADLMLFPLQAANAILAPLVVHLHSQRRPAEIQRVVSLSTIGIAGSTLPLAFLLWFAGAPLLALFGQPFVAARAALACLVAGQLVNALSGSVTLLLTMIGHQQAAAKAAMAGALLNIALNALWIPRYGMFGAAMATACSIALTNCAMLVVVRRRLDIDPSAFGLLRLRRRGAGTDRPTS